MSRNGKPPTVRSARGGKPQKRRGRHLGRTSILAAAKAVALAALGEQSGKIAKETGIAPRTVRDIIARKPPWDVILSNPTFVQFREDATRELEAGFLELAKKQMERAEDTVATASHRDAIVGAAISVDKAQLLGGYATANVDHRHRVEILREEMQSREQMLRRLHDLGILNEVLDVTPEPPKEEAHGHPGS